MARQLSYLYRRLFCWSLACLCRALWALGLLAAALFLAALTFSLAALAFLALTAALAFSLCALAAALLNCLWSLLLSLLLVVTT